MKKLFFVAMLTLLLAGCGTAHFEINKDGSADVTYKVKEDGEFFEEGSLKAALEEEQLRFEEEEGLEGYFKVKSVKEKEGVLTAKVYFKDVGLVQLSEADSLSVYHLPVSEVLESKENWFNGLKDTDGKAIDLESKKLNDYIVLHVTDVMLENISFTLPGKVKYVSEGVTLDGKDHVTTDEYGFTVVYEKEGGFFGTLMKIAIILVVLVALIAIVTSRKSKKTGGTTSNE